MAPRNGVAPAGWQWEKPQRGFSWSRYLSAVRRYKWAMALVILAAVGGGIVLARFVKPTYLVHSTIWIAPETRRDNTAAPVRGDEIMHTAAWPELLTSFAILDRVARRQNLYIEPEKQADAPLFAGVVADERVRPGKYSLRTDGAGRQIALSEVKGQRIQTGLVGDSIGRGIGLRWRPPAEALGPRRDVRFTIVSPREAALALRLGLTASLPDGSNLLRVTLSGKDPQQITDVTQAIVEEFVADAAALKKRNIVEVSNTLKEQLDIAAKDLQDAEAALEAFRVQTITLPTEARPAADGNGEAVEDPLTASYFTEQASYESAHRERTELERTLAAAREGTLEFSALNALPAVRTGAPELQAAITQLADRETRLAVARRSYTDAHPDVQELTREVRELRERTIPRQAGALVTQLRMRENDLQSQMSSTERELREVPRRTTEGARLRRNVATRENLFQRIKSRYEEANLAEASAVPDVSILDAPVVPERPSSNRAPFVILLATLVGIASAGGLAFGLDRWDPRFRYPEQASDELGLDIIGAVPSARPQDARDSAEAMQLVEAFRTIRLNVAQAADTSGRVLITISSPNAGDGKSMIAANLAQSFADSGHRTLLVDGDIRRGELDKRFAIDRIPGLLDYLDGTASLEQVLRPTTSDRLWLLPRGSPQLRGPELLVSPVVPDLMTELQRRFEAVIVDSSPLGAGIDPFVLGAATGNILLVLRAGESNRKLAEAKLRLLTRLPIRVLGVVLNNVRMGGDFQYYAYTYTDLKEQSKIPALETQLTDFARRSGLMR